MKSMDRKKDKDKEDNTLTQQLKLMLVSVNGYEEQRVIEYFVDNMPIVDSRALRYFYDKINPNTTLVADFQCDNCDHSEDMEVPLTIDFFWPKQ